MTDTLPLSLLNDFLYCPRRAALKLVEGWRNANEHTERGDIVHEHSDLAGYEVVQGVTLLRALPVWSERLGLNGKCDIVEAEGLASNRERQVSDRKSEISVIKSGRFAALRPVEFKLGKRRPWENDDVQVCAQGLCLEEMFGIPVPRGAIYHAASKRRREVEFTDELRARTEAAVVGLRALLDDGGVSNLNAERSDSRCEAPRLPPAVRKPACEECSLFDLCLPDLTQGGATLRRAARGLFQI